MPDRKNDRITAFLKKRGDGKTLSEIYRGIGRAFSEDGTMMIARVQKKKSVSISIVNGELNDLVNNSRSGIGLHGVDRDGVSALVVSNTYPDVDFTGMADSVARLIASAKGYDVRRNRAIFSLAPEINIINNEYAHPWERYDLDEIINRALEANREIAKIDRKRLSVTTSCAVVSEEFVIMRGDGTFSAFATPRCALSSSITAKDGAATATVNARLGSSDLSVLFDAKLHSDFMGQARTAAGEAIRLLAAPPVEAGRYRLVIDYALAKGLAHEAFGHAVESDLHKGSIMWENGKFIAGRKVASERVSITDGPIFNDYAWQPVGANGNLRKPVDIVKDGVVMASLADAFSGEDAGVANQNAERVEGFDCPSIPRMTNIRLEYRDPIPVEKPFCEITPAEVNAIVSKNGLLAPDRDTLLLLGYKGGQVNPVTGDYVFNCSMIYKLNAAGVPALHKPAIFAGKTLSTLGSIIGAIGPVKWDALGTCGKSGQGVPSSGGSNYFLVIDANDEITIG